MLWLKKKVEINCTEMCVENGLGRGGHCLCKVSKIETEAIVDLLTFG